MFLPVQTAEPHLGSDTSDEDEGEVRHYKRRRADILEASASVFSDAAEAYGSLPAVRARLERWKQEQAASYRDAHLSLSVPALLAPFVRLQLLQWDPLFGGQAGASLTMMSAGHGWEHVQSSRWGVCALRQRALRQAALSSGQPGGLLSAPAAEAVGPSVFGAQAGELAVCWRVLVPEWRHGW